MRAVFTQKVLGKNLVASALVQHQATVERICKSKPEVSCRQMGQFDVCVSKHKLLEGTEVGVKCRGRVTFVIYESEREDSLQQLFLRPNQADVVCMLTPMSVIFS